MDCKTEMGLNASKTQALESAFSTTDNDNYVIVNPFWFQDIVVSKIN